VSSQGLFTGTISSDCEDVSPAELIQKVKYFMSFTQLGDVEISALDHLEPQLDRATGAGKQFLGTGEILK
jgi:hypothetical protein